MRPAMANLMHGDGQGNLTLIAMKMNEPNFNLPADSFQRSVFERGEHGILAFRVLLRCHCFDFHNVKSNIDPSHFVNLILWESYIAWQRETIFLRTSP